MERAVALARDFLVDNGLMPGMGATKTRCGGGRGRGPGGDACLFACSYVCVFARATERSRSCAPHSRISLIFPFSPSHLVVFWLVGLLTPVANPLFCNCTYPHIR